MDNVRFLSIRQTARRGPLSEYCLRSMEKAGTLPGVYSGRKFLINYSALLKQLGVEADAAEVRS